jgi:hypothetical protein
LAVHAGLGKKQDPSSKITRAKRAGGMTQAIEHLARKCEALSSNPSITEERKEERKKGRKEGKKEGRKRKEGREGQEGRKGEGKKGRKEGKEGRGRKGGREGRSERKEGKERKRHPGLPEVVDSPKTAQFEQ